MKKVVLSLGLAAALVGLSGCNHSVEIQELRDELQSMKSDTTQALQASAAANNKADRALQVANDVENKAGRCCDALKDRIDRIVDKAMRK